MVATVKTRHTCSATPTRAHETEEGSIRRNTEGNLEDKVHGSSSATVLVYSGHDPVRPAQGGIGRLSARYQMQVAVVIVSGRGAAECIKDTN